MNNVHDAHKRFGLLSTWFFKRLPISSTDYIFFCSFHFRDLHSLRGALEINDRHRTCNEKPVKWKLQIKKKDTDQLNWYWWRVERKKLIISHFLPFSNNDTRLKTTNSPVFAPIFCFYCSSASLAWYQINRQSTLDIWSEKKARPALARKNIRDISRESWGHGSICKAISSLLSRLQIVKWEMKCFYLFIRLQSSLTGAKEISFRKEAARSVVYRIAHMWDVQMLNGDISYYTHSTERDLDIWWHEEAKSEAC